MSDTEFTEEEVKNMPMTTAVFEQPKLKFNEHEWRQEGYRLLDVCVPAKATCQNTGLPIPIGKLLIRTKGGYELIDETDSAARMRR